MQMKVRKVKSILLLSSLTLFMTLMCTTDVSAKTVQQPAATLTYTQPGLVAPMITPVDGSVKNLDSHGCFWVAIHGRYFTPSTYQDPQYADLYASDLTKDALTIHPLYARLNSQGAFTSKFFVCGVSFSINVVAFVAVDDQTGARSNPLPMGISPV
jgi:hypothetical protein